MKWVYKVTFPNGKIYVGKDLTGSICYFGTPSSELIARDFLFEQNKDFSVRRELLWWAEDASDSEVSSAEVRLIRELKANDPQIGYNRWPKHRPELES